MWNKGDDKDCENNYDEYLLEYRDSNENEVCFLTEEEFTDIVKRLPC